MANPQREDGHVDIANEIVEALMKVQINGYESRVLWAIFRKTYGWHKKEDWITNSQIAEMTGIAESHVSRTVKMLIDRNLVTKNGKKLSFQKDYEKWKELPKLVSLKKLPDLDKKLPDLVQENTKIGKKKLPDLVDTKETKRNYTKETIQKKGDIFQKAWKGFKTMRNKIKKPMTKRAEELILMSLNKLSSDINKQVAILNQSIKYCWQDVYVLKGDPADEERKPKYIPTAKLTPEQMEMNKRKATEMLNKLKAGVDMPETAKGG